MWCLFPCEPNTIKISFRVTVQKSKAIQRNRTEWIRKVRRQNSHTATLRRWISPARAERGPTCANEGWSNFSRSGEETVPPQDPLRICGRDTKVKPVLLFPQRFTFVRKVQILSFIETVCFQLNKPGLGGSTVFPELLLAIPPVKVSL